METKQQGYFPIPGEKDRYFRFSFGSIAAFEDATGMKVTRLKEEEMGGKELIYLVQAGLKHEGASFDDADDLLTRAGQAGRFQELIDACLDALNYCLGGQKAVEKAKNLRKAKRAELERKNGTGEKSSDGPAVSA